MFCNGYNPVYTNPKLIGPGWCVCDIKCENFKSSVGIDILSIEMNPILEWMPQRLADGQSTFAQVMAWCMNYDIYVYTMPVYCE